MKALYAVIGISLVASNLHAQTVYSLCYDRVDEDKLLQVLPQFAVAVSSATLTELIPNFDELFREAELMLHSGGPDDPTEKTTVDIPDEPDEIISVDIRLCDHALFSSTGLKCDDDEHGLFARVGYGEHYLDNTGQWWKLVDHELRRTRLPPPIYGTLFGRYMYTADRWLKQQLLQEIQSRYSGSHLSPPANGKVTFVLAPDLRSSRGRRLSAESVEIQNLISFEFQGIIDRVRFESFARTLINVDVLQKDDRTAVSNLLRAFAVLFVAYRASFCYELVTDDLPARTPQNTPTTFQSESLRVFTRDSQYLLFGGVRADPHKFETRNAAPISVSVFEALDAMISSMPQEAAAWPFEMDGETFYVTVLR